MEYTEGRNVGYRWYDANVSGDCASATDGTNPCIAFPFGHGLSYSNFEISKVVATPKKTDGSKPIKVQAFVQNTSAIAGAEVVQVYVGVPAAGEPPKRLVAFEKVWLEPGQKKLVQLEIDPAASNHPFGIWDATADAWTTPEGQLQVYVGNSSENAETSTQTITIRDPKRN